MTSVWPAIGYISSEMIHCEEITLAGIAPVAYLVTVAERLSDSETLLSENHVIVPPTGVSRSVVEERPGYFCADVPPISTEQMKGFRRATQDLFWVWVDECETRQGRMPRALAERKFTAQKVIPLLLDETETRPAFITLTSTACYLLATTADSLFAITEIAGKTKSEALREIASAALAIRNEARLQESRAPHGQPAEQAAYRS